MIEILQKVPLFQKLSLEQLENIATICTQKTYSVGTILFHEKDPGSVFYIVGSGSIKIFTTGSNGEEKILATFQAGDSFGELSLIDGKPRSATAQTLETTLVYSISGMDFVNVLKENFEITVGILQELSARLRETNDHVHDLTFLDANTRVIKSLITLASKNGTRQGNHIHIRLILNYDELSQMAGVRKTELMEVIRNFQKRGLLMIGQDSFTIDLSKVRGG